MRWNILRPSGLWAMPRLKDDPAFPGRQYPVYRAQGRRLPGAVGADERDDLSLFDRQRDAPQRVDMPVVAVDVLDLQERHL
jgi:hypothetical protein